MCVCVYACICAVVVVTVHRNNRHSMSSPVSNIPSQTSESHPCFPTETVMSRNDKESEREDKAIQTLSYLEETKENQLQEDSSLTSGEVEEEVHASNDNNNNNNNNDNLSSMSEESRVESQTDV